MTKRALIVAAAGLAALGWVAIAAAQGPPSGGRGRGHGPFARLDLSEEQQEQMKALHEKHRESTKPLFEAARKAQEAFDTALEADTAEAAQVGQAALAMKAAQKKLDAAHQAHRQEMETLLTPEQRAKLEKLGGHHGPPHFGRGMGPGFGPHAGPGCPCCAGSKPDSE